MRRLWAPEPTGVSDVSSSLFVKSLRDISFDAHAKISKELPKDAVSLMSFSTPDLALLGTKAGQERKGAGKLLVEWGIERADRDELETFIYATAAGRPLYERCGFRAVADEIVLDLTQFGVQDSVSEWPMVRQPKHQTAAD